MERIISSCAVGGDSVVRHAGAQLGFDFAHARLRAFEAHGAAQFFGFAAAEVGGDHGHAQQLLLKQRYAQRAFEHGFERGMRIRDVFASLAAMHETDSPSVRRSGRGE